jgi:hypothetical protein
MALVSIFDPRKGAPVQIEVPDRYKFRARSMTLSQMEAVEEFLEPEKPPAKGKPAKPDEDE